jgi:hypothetical protein
MQKGQEDVGETAADRRNTASNRLHKHPPAKSKPHSLLQLLIII